MLGDGGEKPWHHDRAGGDTLKRIKEMYDAYTENAMRPIIGFSGGKTRCSARPLPQGPAARLPVVFSDTDMELPIPIAFGKKSKTATKAARF